MTGRVRSLIDFAYAHETDDEWTTISVTSREMLAVERAVKGFTANTFFANVSVGGLYRVAHVVLKHRGEIDKTLPFEEFVDTYDVKFGAAPSDAESGEDDQDETGSEADPTRPAA